MMPKIRTHKRINDILLGPLERPALKWLAARMPAWVTPDTLTAVGALGSLVIFIGYCLSNLNRNFLWLSCLGFFINWFGDSMDGTLARYREIQRPRYGFFVDHIMDTVSVVLIFLGLGLSPYIHFEVACLALISYLMMSILVYVRTYVDGEFQISYIGIGPTEMRLIAVAANILVYFVGTQKLPTPLNLFTAYDLVGIVIAVLLTGAFAVSGYLQAVKLARTSH
jgi:archaetidylinositol phosphate synthase